VFVGVLLGVMCWWVVLWYRMVGTGSFEYSCGWCICFKLDVACLFVVCSLVHESCLVLSVVEVICLLVPLICKVLGGYLPRMFCVLD